jgi:hypothetical protein
MREKRSYETLKFNVKIPAWGSVMRWLAIIGILIDQLQSIGNRFARIKLDSYSSTEIST